MADSWTHRVFSAQARLPEPGALLEFVNSGGPTTTGSFRGDDRGWFAVQLTSATGLELQVERFLADEEGIRAELNSWAAWLETMENRPPIPALMVRVVTAAQVFTVVQPVRADNVQCDSQACQMLCQYLASQTDGVYQLDGRGFFGGAGELLLPLEE
jgi:hypothetical protein